MALRISTGTFTLSGATPPTTQSITGIGFQPSAVILFSGKQTSTGFTTGAAFSIGYGISSGSFCGSSFATDNVSSSSIASSTRTGAVWTSQTGTGEDNIISMDSVDANGFTVSWDNTLSGQYVISYIAIGGDSITNVGVINPQTSTSIGNVSYTTLGFQPDFALFITSGINYSGSGGMALGFGAAVSSSKRWAFAFTGETGQTMASAVDCMRTQRTNCCSLGLTVSNGTLDHSADFVSFDAQGFTLNWTDGASFSEDLFVLALKGGSYDVGASAKPTGAAPQTQTISGLGFHPSGIMLSSFGIAATTTITSDTDTSLGVHAEGAELSIWAQAKDTVTTECNSHLSTTKALVLAESPSTTDAECDCLLNDGQFELTWTTNNAVASEICYIAFGPFSSLPFSQTVIPQSVKRTSYY